MKIDIYCSGNSSLTPYLIYRLSRIDNTIAWRFVRNTYHISKGSLILKDKIYDRPIIYMEDDCTIYREYKSEDLMQATAYEDP